MRNLLAGIGTVLLATGAAELGLLLSVPFPTSPSISNVKWGISLFAVALAAGVVIALALQASRSQGRGWVSALVWVTAINTVAAPWVISVSFGVPATYGMPPLMLLFWTSLASLALAFAVRQRYADPGSISVLIVGGAVGLAGFALLITQFGGAGASYESSIPIWPKPGEERLDMRSTAGGTTTVTLRYDGGHMQRAYFDKGLLRVSRPAYFRQVEFTVNYGAPSNRQVNFRPEIDEVRTYRDVMQSLLTMGLVKNPEAGIGLAPAPAKKTPLPSASPASSAPPTSP